MAGGEQEGEAVPAASKGSWSSFLKVRNSEKEKALPTAQQQQQQQQQQKQQPIPTTSSTSTSTPTPTSASPASPPPSSSNVTPRHAKPASYRRQLLKVMQQLASFDGDLSRLTAPAFILSNTSLTEFSAYWAEMPHLLTAPAKENDKERRMVLVLKWFLSTLKQQYASRNEKLGSEKKPLNPFLGELHLGQWEDGEGTTHLVSEQVSHHPPVTAYCIWNSDQGVRLEGYNAQKASFGRTINIRQVGHAVLHLDAFDEDYLITLPALHTVGLISGSPYMELNGSSYVVSSAGYTARIDYAGKGYFSGTRNSFTASIFPSGKSKADALYTAEGVWTDGFTIKDASKKTVETYKAKDEKKTPLKVAPVEEQDPLESRRAWQHVARAIEKGDLQTTANEKSVIEEQQRALRKKEKDAGKEWERRFFTRTDKLPIAEKLVKEVPGANLEADQTNGIWLFDQDKAKDAKKPYSKLSEELEEKGWKGWEAK